MAVRLRGRLGAVRSQTGITGLETAIVLIAFVVVASVFAFAVLTTGLISSEKSKEAIIGSLEETGSTLVLRGSMVAVATTSLAHVSNIKFQVGTASKTSDGVDFSDNQIVITYIDQNQAINITSANWTKTFVLGSPPVLDADERVEFDLDIDDVLTTRLATSTEFTVELKPQIGAVLTLTKKTPPELKGAMPLN